MHPRFCAVLLRDGSGRPREFIGHFGGGGTLFPGICPVSFLSEYLISFPPSFYLGRNLIRRRVSIGTAVHLTGHSLIQLHVAHRAVQPTSALVFGVRRVVFFSEIYGRMVGEPTG